MVGIALQGFSDLRYDSPVRHVKGKPHGQAYVRHYPSPALPASQFLGAQAGLPQPNICHKGGKSDEGDFIWPIRTGGLMTYRHPPTEPAPALTLHTHHLPIPYGDDIINPPLQPTTQISPNACEPCSL